MLELERVQYDIERWMANFVEVPHASLGGWSPCPYARRARLDRDFEVRVGYHPFEDLIATSYAPLPKSVLIFAYDPVAHPPAEFHKYVSYVNSKYLIEKDLIALEDHPGDPETVNGVSMNQGTYALILVQQLTDLNEKAKLLAQQGYYNNWPEEYLTELFQHRQDPRS